METTTIHPPWYDSREGIEKSITTLAGFHLVLAERARAFMERGGRLNAWCVFGRFWLDCFGQCMTITDGAPADARNRRDPPIANVLTREEALKYSEHWSAGILPVPMPHERCPRCLLGWDLPNLHDVFALVDEHGERSTLHRECARIKYIQIGLQELSEIVHGVWAGARLDAIPNQYWSTGRTAPPWAIVSSPFGPIRIGWRKNVINISWADAPTLAHITGEQIRSDPTVTAGVDFVHCWGRNKAVEALRKLDELAVPSSL